MQTHLDSNLEQHFTNRLFGMASTYQYLGFEQTEVNVRLKSALLEITDSFLLQVEFQGLKFGDVLNSIGKSFHKTSPGLIEHLS